jgi:hypothetical protein
VKKIIIFSVLALGLSSCMVNRLTVGNGPEGMDYYSKKTYAYAKHIYVVLGIFSLKDPKLEIPKHGNYQFEAATDADDWALSLITGGLVSTRTERIFIKKIDVRKAIREKLN